MDFVLLLIALVSVVRGVIARHFEIPPFFGSNFWLIFPDLIFAGVAIYWIYIVKKIKFSFPLFVYLLSFVFSLVWDYQSGYFVLKGFFPLILFLILNRESIEKITIRGVLASVFYFMFLPLIYLGQLISKITSSRQNQTNEDENKQTSSGLKRPLIFAGIFGVFLGLIILAIITNLDPEFGKFLNLKELWEVFGHAISSFIYYIFVFVWFFFMPVDVKWGAKEFSTSFLRLMQGAVMVIVAIVIGYSIYDAYIILRVLKMISLVFESMGKNTQLYFLELVFLGGGLMYAGSYLLSKLAGHEKENAHARRMNLILIATLALLIPPVFNVLRALLNVYIPAFGLTALRLFGIATTVSFIIAFLTIIYSYFKNKSSIFTKSILGFVLPLIIFSFVVPNNLIVGSWHFSKYLKGEGSDFNYFRKIKLEKWGGIFLMNLQADSWDGYSKIPRSDAFWGLLLSRETLNKKDEESYQKKIVIDLKEQVNDIANKIKDLKFSELILEHGARDKKWWVYEGGQVSDYDVAIANSMGNRSLGADFDKTIDTGLNDSYFFSKYDWSDYVYFLNQNFDVTLIKKNSGVRSLISKNIYFNLDIDHRSDENVVKITSDFEPFWVADAKSYCVISSAYSYQSCPTFINMCYGFRNQPNIPSELFKQYFESKTSLACSGNNY